MKEHIASLEALIENHSELESISKRYIMCLAEITITLPSLRKISGRHDLGYDNVSHLFGETESHDNGMVFSKRIETVFAKSWIAILQNRWKSQVIKERLDRLRQYCLYQSRS